MLQAAYLDRCIVIDVLGWYSAVIEEVFVLLLRPADKVGTPLFYRLMPSGTLAALAALQYQVNTWGANRGRG